MAAASGDWPSPLRLRTRDDYPPLVLLPLVPLLSCGQLRPVPFDEDIPPEFCVWGVALFCPDVDVPVPCACGVAADCCVVGVAEAANDSIGPASSPPSTSSTPIPTPATHKRKCIIRIPFCYSVD
jgi:hypothetical protein